MLLKDRFVKNRPLEYHQIILSMTASRNNATDAPLFHVLVIAVGKLHSSWINSVWDGDGDVDVEMVLETLFGPQIEVTVRQKGDGSFH